MDMAERPPETPVAPPPKERETREVIWAGVPDELHCKVHGPFDQFKRMWSGKLGELKATTHDIQLKPDAKPVYSAPYRSGPHRRLKIEKQVKRMLNLGATEASDAGCSFPVVVVSKPGGHFRVCVDSRWKNERTVKDVFPIPRMDDSLDPLGDATVSCTLHCNSGYWKIRLAAEDRDYTTFTSHAGLFRLLRLPFGMVNAPASFQRALDTILSGFLLQTHLVYLGDVIGFSRTVD